MKKFTKIISVILSMMFIASCFAGCSSSDIAEEITDKTLLIAYTQENAPFVYTDENGKLTGFDVEIFSTIFDDIKNDYKDYQFVKVDSDYQVGEDTAYTDDDGNEYIAYIMIGGIQKNQGSFNEDYTFSESVIDNRIITVTAKDSKVKAYGDFKGAVVGTVTEQAKAAFDNHSAIKNACKNVSEYKDIETALNDLNAGKIDAVVTDEFTFNVLDSKDNYTVLESELETISYVYSFKKWDWYVDSVNEAIYELKSPEYNDADNFTPIVEKYFGYNASSFNYTPDND
ncbi:MAG: substrate-binding periplasmic protein [Eubacterium sp.]